MKRKLHILLAVGIGLTTSVGWLQAKTVEVTDGAGLLKEVAAASEGDTIELAAGNYVLDKQLVISKPIVLLGSISEKGGPASIISADLSAEWPTKPNTTELQNSTANLISIQGKGEGTVTLKNIQVTKSLASGINVQSVMKTVLNNVHSVDNTNAGLLVHSTVEAIGLHTHSNGWGGVNVDKKMDNNPSFKFDETSSFNEPSKIWTEKTETEDLVTLPANSNWKTYLANGSDYKTKMRYWTNLKLSLDYDIKGVVSVYANGTPVTIESAGNEKVDIKSEEGVITLPENKKITIFGGSKNATVESASITLKSGKIYNIYGGGHGVGNKAAGTQANVTKTTTIKIEGGEIQNLLVGGGYYYSRTDSVHMEITDGKISTIYAGGYNAGEVTSNLNTSFEESVTRVRAFDLKVYGDGTKEIKYLGCGGGQGYSYTKNSTVSVENATIGGLYGVLSNGCADNVTGTFSNVTFKKIGADYEFAAVNRGRANSVEFNFDGCSFNNLDQIYANLGTIDGWASSDTDGKIIPVVKDKVVFTFKNSKTTTPLMKVGQGLSDANVVLIGAVAKVDSALKSDKDGVKIWFKEFTQNANKTWTFNDGLAMSSGVTLTKNGTLNYGKSFTANVASVKEMQNAMGMIKVGDDNVSTAVINIENDLTFDNTVDFFGESENFEWKGIFFLKNEKMKNLALTVNGNGHSITGTKGCDDTVGSKNYLFYLANGTEASAFTLNNLTVKDLDIVGFNLYNLNGITFNNVDMTGNKQGAIHLNSSKLTANKLTTSGNKKFAIKLSRQVANLPGVVLNDGCKLAETDVTQIGYYDRAAYNLDKDITIPATTDIIKMVSGSYGNTLARSWAKATLHTDKNDALARVWTSNLTTLNINNSGGAVKLDPNATGLDLLLIDTGFANVEGVMNTGVKSETFNKEFTASALNSGLIINCEDAYLVTGKDEAQDFAEIAKNKPVYQLALADKKLAVVSAFGTPTIDGIESWNDTKFAKQNVIITKNGNLTINVAMALDTIFMEEGAQLKVLANTAVTANAVQLKYAATSNWKAFGFPYTIDKVKDAAGTEVKTTAGTFGKEETGFWTANVKAGEVAFALTSAAATPASACLIAATRDDKRDSLIYVTSNAVTELKTIAAPTAPASDKTTTPISLAMIANPNLHPTQVMGNVYIYDAAQNVFTQQFNPEVAPFQSYIVADAATTSTLRSLRVGDAPTGNEEITPVEGYYVEAGHGMITIRTAEPVQVIVADMLGRIVYNARVTTDGQQINLPAGIYAVNKQKVIVK